jgi:hypothetical protein
MSLGGVLLAGNSKLFDGPLGVIKVGFAGYDCGLTTADSKLTPDQDIKGIKYQQHGTKDADHVRTGIEYVLDVTFGEISTGLIKLLMSGISSENESEDSDSGTIGRSLYQSMLEGEANVCKIASVNENGVASEEPEDIICFYIAIPIVNGDLVNWGADTQRMLNIQFKIKFYIFATGESSTKDGAFGYWGDPTVEDVPAIVWPDVEAPVIVSATVTAATTMDIVFDEDVAFFGAGSYVAGTIVAKVEEEFIIATSASITDATVTATFPAATFGIGDTVELYISGGAIEDDEATPNVYPGLSDYTVSNPLS